MKSEAEIIRERNALLALLARTKQRYNELTQIDKLSETGAILLKQKHNYQGGIDVLNWILRT